MQLFWKDGDYEIVGSGSYVKDGYLPRAELVKYIRKEENREKTRQVIAYWERDPDDWTYHLVFCYDIIYMSQMDISKIWPQLCAAQIMLNGWVDGKKKR